MDSTTHTTTTVEFVDWRAKAKEKLTLINLKIYFENE